MNPQGFTAAANAEPLPTGPGDVGLASLPIRAFHNATSRTSGWWQHHGSRGRTRTFANRSGHEQEGDGLPHCLRPGAFLQAVESPSVILFNKDLSLLHQGN